MTLHTADSLLPAFLTIRISFSAHKVNLPVAGKKYPVAGICLHPTQNPAILKVQIKNDTKER